MNDRVFRIALIHLSQTPEIDTTNTENLNISDKDIIRITEDALNLHFNPIITITLKRIQSTPDLFALSKYVVKQYHISGEVENKLDEAIKVRPLNRNTLLKEVETLAYDRNNSIKQTMLDYFRENPTTEEDEIKNHVKTFLIKIRDNIKANMTKMRRLV